MIPCTLPQWHKTPLGHTNTLFWHSWRALHLNRMDLPLTSPRRWFQDTRWRFQVQLSDWSSISLNLGFPPIHQVLLLVQVIYITIIQCDWPGTHELLYPTILCNLSFFYHTSYLMCFTLYLKFAFRQFLRKVLGGPKRREHKLVWWNNRTSKTQDRTIQTDWLLVWPWQEVHPIRQQRTVRRVGSSSITTYYYTKQNGVKKCTKEENPIASQGPISHSYGTLSVMI